MYLFPSLFFEFSNKSDLQKKSKTYSIQNIIALNKKKLSLFTSEKKKTKRDVRINMFWSLEVITLQKAFFKYKLKKARKSFYAVQGIYSQMQNKKVTLFLFVFMQKSLFSTPYLKFFFIVNSLRNLKIETISIFDFVKQNYKLFYNVTDSFVNLKKNDLTSSIWLSLYKVLL